MKALIDNRYLFWLLLALPAVPVLLSDAIAMDKLHPTGEWSARFLVLALMVTPLTLLFRRAKWTLWLQARRRYLGVAAFGYAALHLLYYAIDMGALDAIVGETFIPSLLTGWIAFFAMLALALTSNDASMRALKAGWKRLQRLAYPAAVLTLVHWWLIHDGAMGALLHFAPLAALEIYRIIHRLNRRSHAHA